MKQDKFSLYFWFIETDQTHKADELLNSIPKKNKEAFITACYTVFGLALKNQINAYTFIILHRFNLAPAPMDLDDSGWQHVAIAVALQYCLLIDLFDEKDANTILWLSSQEVTQFVFNFLTSCDISSSLVEQLVVRYEREISL